ncbi:MAG TPA: tetratricopeptide repeat protein [Desulfobacterales bacterium]|nr:tetratricopeptide repeat protein [Desulfobacterales bacterium]
MITVSYYLLLFLLIFSPLAFGTVDTLPLMLTQAASFGGLFLYSLAHLLPGRKKICRPPGLIPLCLVLGFLLFQAIPLPMGILKILSPAAYKIRAGMPGIAPLDTWAPLTINSRATFTQIFHYTSFLACYVLACSLLTDRRRCRQVVSLLIIVGAIIALQAILQKGFGNGRLLWLRLPPDNASQFVGSFAYRNQFAAYMEMLAPLALAFCFFYSSSLSGREPLRRRLSVFFNKSQSNLQLLLGFATVLMVAAVFLSTSRGGIISVFLACIIVIFLLKRYHERQYYSVYLLLIFLCMAFLIGGISLEAIFSRFDFNNKDFNQIIDGRFAFWKQGLPLIKDYFLTGSGLGTYGNIFPTYSLSFIVGGRSFLYHPHNEYLEAFSDLGLIGLTFLGCFFYSAVRGAYAGYMERRDRFARYLFIAAAAGLFAQLLHMLVEYNLASGAVGLTFFTVLALLVSGGHTRFHGHGAASSLPGGGFWYIAALTVVSGLLLIASLYWNISSLLAYNTLPGPVTWNRDTPAAELKVVYGRAVRASRLMPLQSYYHFARADTAALLGWNEEAGEQYRQAIRLDPVMPVFLEGFASFLAGEGRNEQAAHFFALAVRHDRANARRYEHYGRWLLTVGRRKKAFEVFSRAMGVAPKAAKTIIPVLMRAGFAPLTIAAKLPERMRPYMVLAGLLTSRGRIKEADKLYGHAMELAAREPKLRAWFFNAPFRFYQRRKQPVKALAVLQRGISLLPDDIGLRLKLARLYERQGERDKAAAAYRKVLRLKPGQRQAVKRLRALIDPARRGNG